MPRTDVLGTLAAQTAVVAAVIPVQLLLFLLAGERALRHVDDDDVVPGIDERRVGRFVLALQQLGREAGHPPDRHVGRVDEVPPPRDLARGREER
jgi:hypothetical protein